MKNHPIWLILLIIIYLGCGEKKPTTPQTQDPNPTTEPKEEPKNNEPSPEEQIIKVLESYYQDISNKEVEIDDYFAPVVEKFYSQQNQRNDKVSAIIRNGYGDIEERTITLDRNSVKVTPVGGGYEVLFKGHASVRRKGEQTRKEEDFYNRFVFNSDYRIVQYDKAPESSVMNQKGSSGSGASSTLESVNEIVFSGLTSSNLSNADTYIDPESGVLYLARSGAFDAIYVCKTLADIPKFSPWMKDNLSKTSCNIKMEAVPEFDCEDFSKQGCFLDRISGYNRASQVIKGLRENDLLNLDDAQVRQAKALENKVEMQLVMTDQALALYFGQVNGQWRLLIVDAAEFDCSA